MSKWQPIETAPRGGTLIDLWVVDETGEGWREPSAYFVKDVLWERYEYAADGSYKQVSSRRDGWFAPNHDYDGMDGWCDFPRSFNEHPNQRKWQFKTPTHWMPLPAPPNSERGE